MAFKVIEGGGPRPPDDFDVKLAAQSLRFLTIELLRAIVRGDDLKRRVTTELIEFYNRLGKEGIKVDVVVKVFLEDLHSELTEAETSDRQSDDADREIEHIILASFQVAAEKLSLDDAAQGRTSQRRRRLDDCIEARLRGLQERSRRHSQRPRNSPRKLGNTADYDVEAYERLLKGEITHFQLPPGKYPGGIRVYADGEWEELVRKSPLTKLERAALEAYFKAKDSIEYVKGAGPATNDRLIARGFIAIIQEREADRVPYHGITPAGVAEWLRITQDDRR